MKEQDLVNAILAYLHLRGAWAIRINAGMRPIEDGGNRRMIRLAPAGTPDILASIGGIFYGIEVKLPGNKPTTTQLACHEDIRQAGGVVIVAYSLDDVMEAI